MNQPRHQLLDQVFTFQTPEEARSLAALLATLCPNGEMVELGLVELLLNAIEHGNLGLTYEAKRQCLLEERFFEEIAHRLRTPPFSQRQARVSVHQDGIGLFFLIEDQGEGFDWHALDLRYPPCLTEPNGRGIAIARLLSFDELEFLGSGNRVRATVLFNPAA